MIPLLRLIGCPVNLVVRCPANFLLHRGEKLLV